MTPSGVPIGIPITLQGAVLEPSQNLQLTTPATIVLVNSG